MTKLKAWEHILMLMVPTMKGNGSMISSMAMVWNHGLTALAMKESMKMARRKVKAGLPSQTEAITREPSSTMRLVALVTTTGQMASHMPVTGARIKWMVRASSSGRMVKCTVANL